MAKIALPSFEIVGLFVALSGALRPKAFATIGLSTHDVCWFDWV
jgi:hypothetical protein